MVLLKSVIVFCMGLGMQFPIILSTNLNSVSQNEKTKYCQEFRTKADRYVNFFALDYLHNEKMDDELFRYKLFVNAANEIHILLVESDYAESNTRCYEFGINVPNPLAATFRTNIGGSIRVRTEEKLPPLNIVPMSVEIIGKTDGEVQMFVASKPYPLLRFPDNTLEPKFISFTTQPNSLAQFYFNCQEDRYAHNDGLSIPDEHARPVVYISFQVNSMSREANKLSIALHYNMTFFTTSETFTASELSAVQNMHSLSKAGTQLPKLEIFNENYDVTRTEPVYSLAIDSNKIITSANETISVECKGSGKGKDKNPLYCNLEFGLEGMKYHLAHYPSGVLLDRSFAEVADVKVFQSANSASISAVPFKTDIEMKFKLN